MKFKDLIEDKIIQIILLIFALATIEIFLIMYKFAIFIKIYIPIIIFIMYFTGLLIEYLQKNKYYSNRANSNIGYTMLCNLTQIIISNWDDFSDIIPTQAWITSRMDDLEMSRNIIMHTGLLPDIEMERIESIVRDLVKQLG